MGKVQLNNTCEHQADCIYHNAKGLFGLTPSSPVRDLNTELKELSFTPIRANPGSGLFGYNFLVNVAVKKGVKTKGNHHLIISFSNYGILSFL